MVQNADLITGSDSLNHFILLQNTIRSIPELQFAILYFGDLDFLLFVLTTLFLPKMIYLIVDHFFLGQQYLGIRFFSVDVYVVLFELLQMKLF